jgi:hypothetical protein
MTETFYYYFLRLFAKKLPPELIEKWKRSTPMGDYLEEVRQEGREETKTQTALNLLELGVSHEIIIKSLHVSDEWFQEVLKKSEIQNCPS